MLHNIINFLFLPIYSPDYSLKEQKIIDPNTVRFLGSVILIVDDISDNRKYLAGILMNYNLEVMQASNGEEALFVIKNNHVRTAQVSL